MSDNFGPVYLTPTFTTCEMKSTNNLVSVSFNYYQCDQCGAIVMTDEDTLTHTKWHRDLYQTVTRKPVVKRRSEPTTKPSRPVPKKRGVKPQTAKGVTEVTRSPVSGRLLPNVVVCPLCNEATKLRGKDSDCTHRCSDTANYTRLCMECGEVVEPFKTFQYAYPGERKLWVGHIECVVPNFSEKEK